MIRVVNQKVVQLVLIVSVTIVSILLIGHIGGGVSRAQATGQPLKLAVEAQYPPFLFVENDEVKGISYEYTKLIASKLNVDLQLTKPLQLQQMLDAVKNGDANLLADITKTPERDKYLEFSDAYTSTPAVVIAPTGSKTKWDNESSNKGLTIAVGKGYGVVEYLKQKYPLANLVEVESDADIIEDVSTNNSDVGVLDVGSLSYLLQKTPVSNIEVVSETDFSYSLSFAVAERDKDLIPQINNAIDEISSAEKNAIYSKWINNIPNRQSAIISNTTVLFLVIVILLISLIIFAWAFSLKRIVTNKTSELKKVNEDLNDIFETQDRDFEILKNTLNQNKTEVESTKKALLNVVEDIGKEKAKLELVSNRLELASKSAEIGVWEWDITNNILTWDEQMYKLYGIKKEDFGGAYNAWRKGLHPDDVKAGDQAIQDAIDNKAKFDTLFRVVWPDKSIHFIRAYAEVKRDENGKAISMTGVNFDVTKEQEISKAKNEFVSLASHQLRTPLSSINWYSEILLNGDAGKLTKKQHEYVSQVDRANTRMVELINALLNVSRLELGTFMLDAEKLNLKQCSEQIITEIKTRSDEKHQKLNITFEPHTPDIIFDKKYLEMLYQNLLSNAVKYTPEKGKIDLVVGPAKAGETIDGYKIPKAGVVITVADNGYGIPKNQQDKIMTKLFRADNALDKDADGTGLGLYIIKSVIDHSKGNLWFKSTENKGTAFHAYLPLETAKKEGTKKLS